jgi:hypothetical protein
MTDNTKTISALILIAKAGSLGHIQPVMLTI